MRASLAQVKSTTIFGATAEGILIKPFDHHRGHPWTVTIKESMVTTRSKPNRLTAAVAPSAALRVDTAVMPTGSVTHVRRSSLKVLLLASQSIVFFQSNSPLCQTALRRPWFAVKGQMRVNSCDMFSTTVVTCV
jgi:hypothetical protein